MCSEGRRHDGDDIHIVSAEKCNTMEVTGFCLTAAVSDVFCIKVSVGFILREHESLCNTADNSCTVVKIFFSFCHPEIFVAVMVKRSFL